MNQACRCDDSGLLLRRPLVHAGPMRSASLGFTLRATQEEWLEGAWNEDVRPDSRCTWDLSPRWPRHEADPVNRCNKRQAAGGKAKYLQKACSRPFPVARTPNEDIMATATEAQAARERRSSPLTTPTDLKPAATRDIAAALNLILADVFALYLKTKNFHWHMSGPHFR